MGIPKEHVGVNRSDELLSSSEFVMCKLLYTANVHDTDMLFERQTFF